MLVRMNGRASVTMINYESLCDDDLVELSHQ